MSRELEDQVDDGPCDDNELDGPENGEDEESDPAEGLISTVSPIGRSLMGKEEGDEVEVTIPSGSRRFEIRKLKTLHDEAV